MSRVNFDFGETFGEIEYVKVLYVSRNDTCMCDLECLVLNHGCKYLG